VARHGPESRPGISRNTQISVHLMTVDGLLSRRAALAEELRHLTFLIAPIHGDLVIEQYDRTSRLGPGDALLLDSLAGCTIVALNACTALSIELRRSTLSRFGVPAHELCARRIAGDGRVGGLLSNMVSTVAAGALDYGSQDGVILEDVLATVAARSLLCESSAAEESRTRALILRMREWMLRNAGSPALSPGELADRFGMSRRALYRVFAEIGTTPVKWMWDIRLDIAQEVLTTTRKSVASVAFSVGFSDSGHFSRLYKRRFGETPTSGRSSRTMR
jgi:AraC-like DNA-binding protein